MKINNSNAIFDLKKLQKRLKTIRRGKIVVLATGVFDILHVEHVRFLKKAKRQGDVLVVGIESDVRVRKLKGQDRPINLQQSRAEVIDSLKPVDYVFILPSNLSTKKGREDLIRKIKPDIYAVSANTPYQKEKKRIMKKFGGKLRVVHTHNPDISTTKVLKLSIKKNQ